MSKSETVLGLDIGGANLKAALPDGRAMSRPFPLWRRPGDLAAELAALLGELPRTEIVAVTMTGELCDCFKDKREGVAHILSAVEQAAEGRRSCVWRTDGSFVDPSTARHQSPSLVAAANWLALATWAGRHLSHGPGLLVDVGSTTSDIIPLRDGLPIPAGRTDPERMKTLELVYTGVRRTPLCAILGFGGAAELFATTQDAYLVLGWIDEDPNDTDTADGRPATTAFAHARLARMKCADLETSTADERIKLAKRVLLKQVYHIGFAIEQAVKRLGSPPHCIMVAGSGERLAQVAVQETLGKLDCKRLSLTAGFGPHVSRAACAYALAVLASERIVRIA